MDRNLLAAIVVSLIGCWFIFDLGQYFTLEQAKAQQLALKDTIAAQPFTASLTYFVIYVLVTVLVARCSHHDLTRSGIVRLLVEPIIGFLRQHDWCNVSVPLQPLYPSRLGTKQVWSSLVTD